MFLKKLVSLVGATRAWISSGGFRNLGKWETVVFYQYGERYPFSKVLNVLAQRYAGWTTDEFSIGWRLALTYDNDPTTKSTTTGVKYGQYVDIVLGVPVVIIVGSCRYTDIEYVVVTGPIGDLRKRMLLLESMN